MLVGSYREFKNEYEGRKSQEDKTHYFARDQEIRISRRWSFLYNMYS